MAIINNNPNSWIIGIYDDFYFDLDYYKESVHDPKKINYFDFIGVISELLDDMDNYTKFTLCKEVSNNGSSLKLWFSSSKIEIDKDDNRKITNIFVRDLYYPWNSMSKNTQEKIETKYNQYIIRIEDSYGKSFDELMSL